MKGVVRLLTAKAEPLAPRGPKFAPTDQLRDAQVVHLSRLRTVRRYPDCTFENEADLARHIAYTAILDLLVVDYAREAAAARDVAEGFIREMAARVATDPSLDLEAMKGEVRTAIEIYEREIAGGKTPANLGEIVDRALANAKRLADEGKSRLARAALRKTAEALRREGEERRAAHAARVEALFGYERDIALAAYDGEAAADAIVSIAKSLHSQSGARRGALVAQGDELYEFGDRRGSNVHLIAAISVRAATLPLAATADEIGLDWTNLGNAMLRLGERESGTARLEEAVSAYRAALEAFIDSDSEYYTELVKNNLDGAQEVLKQRQG